MSENILSLEDLKFLEKLYTRYGTLVLRFDDNGILINNEYAAAGKLGEDMEFLTEISRKMKYRLNSNCQMNFSNGGQFDLIQF